MTDLAAAKTAARKTALAARSRATPDMLRAAAGNLSSVLAGHRGVPLAGYMPMRGEADPLPAMDEASAHGPVGVPVITAKAHPLSFHLWTPEATMVPGTFGALIPEGTAPMTPEILIVPLVAFDRQGGRLGYGGGFYDRTLERLRAAGPVLAVGFAFALQEVPELPLEPTDQPLDLLVTDAGVQMPDV